MGLGPVNRWDRPVQPQHRPQAAFGFYVKPNLVALPSPRFAGKDAFIRVGAPEEIPLPQSHGTHTNILLPDGIPIFYLHGTWKTTSSLKPIVDFIGNVQTRHPSYMSFIPEVKEASGIERVNDPETKVPAFKQAIRDMGDFQYQFIYQNLKKLQELLDLSSREERQEKIGDFFHILPEERSRLVPILEDFLKTKVFEVPPGLNISESLFAMTTQGVQRVQKEFSKLRVDTRNRDILDTYLLYHRAQAEGKQVNLNMYEVYHDPNTINLRPLNLKDISFLNAYLIYLEKELTTDLQAAYKRSDDFSEKMAAKLLEAVAPRGLAFGHSQGGTVLLSALLKYLAMPPKTPAEAFDLNSEDVDRLGGRFIGMGSFFSAPLHGIPDEPLWGRPISEFFGKFERKIRGPISSERMISRWLIKNIGWRLFARKKQAVNEMREGSELLKRVQRDINRVREREVQVTLISVHDKNDTFIEPAATILTNEQGEKFPNIFNIGLTMPPVRNPFEGPQDILEQLIRIMKYHPDSPMAKTLRKLPRRFHEFLFRTYKQSFTGLYQHSALLNFPRDVHQELGKKLIKDPERQARLLSPVNFEPFRYQSLIARRKITQKQILDQPLPVAMDNLQRFQKEYPSFLPAVIENAKQALPLENSASYEANRLLGSILELFGQAVADSRYRARYGSEIKKSLQEIAKADIPPLTSSRPAISHQAEGLLNQLENPPPISFAGKMGRRNVKGAFGFRHKQGA